MLFRSRYVSVALFRKPNAPAVKIGPAMEMILAGATLLDVRDRTEWNTGHAPGALHIPLSQVAAQASKRLPKGRPVIVACKSGSRARMAAKTLAEQGVDARVLSGGMTAWESAGGRVVNKSNREGIIQ